MDQAAVARHRLEAVEARTHSLCRAATLRRRPGPGGANRRQPTWSMAARKQPRAHHRNANRLLRFTRPAVRRQTANRIIHRTAVYGPVRTVVWEGRSREAPPYPDSCGLRSFLASSSGQPPPPGRSIGAVAMTRARQMPVREDIMGKSNRGGRASPPDFAAGNGLINRRALLGQGIALAGAAGVGGAVTGAAAEPLKDEAWSLEFGSIMQPREMPSRFEKDVVRSLSNAKGEFRNSHARTPHHLLNGTITPNQVHFAINHAGVPDIDPAKHKLVIHGMVRQPLEFPLETLSRYPLVTRMAFLECAGNSAPMFSSEPVQVTAQAIHGLVSNSEW